MCVCAYARVCVYYMRVMSMVPNDAALDEAFEQDSAGGLSEASSDEEEGAGKKVRNGSEGDDDSGGEFSDSESDNLSEIDEDEEELQRIQEELEKDDSNEREENLADMLRDVMNTKTRLKNKYNELRFEKKTYEELFQQHGGEYGMSSEKFAQTVKEATIMRKLLHKTQLEKQTLEHQAGMQNALEFIVAELQENVSDPPTPFSTSNHLNQMAFCASTGANNDRERNTHEIEGSNASRTH